MKQRMEDAKGKAFRPVIGFASVLGTTAAFMAALVAITFVIRFVAS